MQTQLSRYCKQEDMFHGHKLSDSRSNQSQPKIFPFRILSLYPRSVLTVENLKRLEEEYAASKKAFKMQRMQDYIEQVNLALFNKETTRTTSRDFVCDAEPEGASSSLPAKQANIVIEFSQRPLKKEERLTGRQKNINQVMSSFASTGTSKLSSTWAALNEFFPLSVLIIWIASTQLDHLVLECELQEALMGPLLKIGIFWMISHP
ncbi:uncharacterized protein LOC111937123 isoform X1 [Cyanistes caeruleus]|uniref:uncharacterized protein LOC111937123 isoform X1 n=1 Tax=Cyanistes caeruleus TaxID=156563 RepID=UPI000CDAB1A3|nr:uncharacterized protein LOC111937123 isoform X1 [Cyanistes caeruleus]XP_023794243.1 uncharacterized protein LOC111937123 isoform X1 [Cyanistes caeruleus]